VGTQQQLATAQQQARVEDKRILLHVALNRNLPGGDTFTTRLHNFFTTNSEIEKKLDERCPISFFSFRFIVLNSFCFTRFGGASSATST
jgi:hypothetical protein